MTVADKVTLNSNVVKNPLSEREMEVARLLATGASNSEIANELTISPHTVKVHLRNIFDKLQVNSRTEASMVLVHRGWLTVPGFDSPADTTETATIAVPIDPEPLSHVEATPMFWQRLYLVGALLATLLSFFTPNLLSRTRAAPNLLSDRGQRELGQPQLTRAPRWVERTPLHEPRSRLTLAQVGNKVYAIGGETVGGRTLAQVDMYDLAVNDWQVVEPLPQPLGNAAASAVENYIYVAGGSYFSTTEEDTPVVNDQIFRLGLDSSTGLATSSKWETYGSLPAPLAGAAMVTVGDVLYLIGGWDGEMMRNEIWRLKPPADGPISVDSWNLVNRMEAARAFFGVVLFKEKLYIVGGHDGQRELSRADAFDPAVGTWTPLPPLVNPRGGLSLATDGRSIFAIGGGWNEPVTTVERFDPNTKLWSNFPSPIRGEWRHMVAYSHENSLYLMGGWSGAYLNYHLQYENQIRQLLLPLIQTN